MEHVMINDLSLKHIQLHVLGAWTFEIWKKTCRI